MTARTVTQIVLGCFLTLLAGVAVTTYALWNDGQKFALTRKAYQPAPAGLSHPSYLDSSRFHWKTPEALRRYVQDHRNKIIDELKAAKSP